MESWNSGIEELQAPRIPRFQIQRRGAALVLLSPLAHARPVWLGTVQPAALAVSGITTAGSGLPFSLRPRERSIGTQVFCPSS